MEEVNSFVALLVMCVIAAIIHRSVRDYWRACWISAVWCVAIYASVVVLFVEKAGRFFSTGMIIVGIFGYGLAMVVGIPFVKSRRGGCSWIPSMGASHDRILSVR